MYCPSAEASAFLFFGIFSYYLFFFFEYILRITDKICKIVLYVWTNNIHLKNNDYNPERMYKNNGRKDISFKNNIKIVIYSVTWS